MTMHFRELANQAVAGGKISADEIIALRREAWPDGKIDADEADAIFDLGDLLKYESSEWVDFFVEAICEFLIDSASPKGYLSDEQAAWLIARIDRDERLDSMAELELLEKLFEAAESVPASLQNYALTQIEKAVLAGNGPTRDGQSLDPGCINAEECRLLRRFIFAPAGERPAAVGKVEAEMLFRLKDATLGANNAAEWKQLFVQGVGNYLQGFGDHEPLSAARAGELEAFLNDTSVNIGRFFSRMGHGNMAAGAHDMVQSDPDHPDFEEQAAADAEVTGEERQWLQAHLDTDHELDDLEKALIDFLTEEQ